VTSAFGEQRFDSSALNFLGIFLLSGADPSKTSGDCADILRTSVNVFRDLALKIGMMMAIQSL